jgi:hypothetical protein
MHSCISLKLKSLYLACRDNYDAYHDIYRILFIKALIMPHAIMVYCNLVSYITPLFAAILCKMMTVLDLLNRVKCNSLNYANLFII